MLLFLFIYFLCPFHFRDIIESFPNHSRIIIEPFSKDYALRAMLCATRNVLCLMCYVLCIFARGAVVCDILIKTIVVFNSVSK